MTIKLTIFIFVGLLLIDCGMPPKDLSDLTITPINEPSEPSPSPSASASPSPTPSPSPSGCPAKPVHGQGGECD